MTTLNTTTPLNIRNPKGAFAVGATETARASAPVESSTQFMKAHTDLTEAAQETREFLCRAIDWRWWDKRYGPLSAGDTDHQFGMQMMMHPAMTPLSHTDILCDDKERAAEIKETITDRVMKLAVELAEKGEGMEEPASNGQRRAPSGTSGDSGMGGRDVEAKGG